MEIYVSAIKEAADTWADIRKIHNYNLVVGRALFQNLFTLDPQALSLYRFRDAAPSPDSIECVTQENLNAILESPAFQRHTTAVVAMLGAVLGLMQGDEDGLSDLADNFKSLGKRHVSYGVNPTHYTNLETALLRTLQGILPVSAWTEDVRKGWAAIVKFIAKGMQAGAHSSSIEISKDSHHRSQLVDSDSPSGRKLRLTLSKNGHGPPDHYDSSESLKHSRHARRKTPIVLSKGDRSPVWPKQQGPNRYSRSKRLMESSHITRDHLYMPTWPKEKDDHHLPPRLPRREPEPYPARRGNREGYEQDAPPLLPKRIADLVPEEERSNGSTAESSEVTVDSKTSEELLLPTSSCNQRYRMESNLFREAVSRQLNQ